MPAQMVKVRGSFASGRYDTFQDLGHNLVSRGSKNQGGQSFMFWTVQMVFSHGLGVP